MIVVGPSKIHGRGVLAAEDISSGVVVGPVFRAKPGPRGMLVQVTSIGWMVNHSSQPTAQLIMQQRGSISEYYMKVIYPLRRGTEIAVDYNTCPWFIASATDLGLS